MKKFPITIAICLTLILLMYCNRNKNSEKSATTTDSTASVEQKVASKKNILFFGNSLTAGYGLDNAELAFPTLIQHKIDSLGLAYHCINGGLSGETSAGGKDRIDWLLKEPVDVFVLELGANDGLRGISPESTYQNLTAIVEKVKKAYPECKLVLTGMKVPPSMGDKYFKEFEAIFPKLAKEQQMTFVPFLLEGVAGIAKLNQQDAVHPTVEGQRIVAENVWSQLKTIL